ncbi:ester cyclase [Maribacter halichondriae]|uniref:ester cyclase n=1 Tax=Maribacter halichondriae TaxID=2980554 RepID=UPI002359016C|nr:ester cyclase [Maribacter sp. Hal144]
MKIIGLTYLLFLALNVSCKGDVQSTPNMKEQISQNQISSNLNCFVDHAWNGQNVDSLRSISTENVIRNQNGIEVASNQNELEANMNIFFTAFPDLHLQLEHSDIQNDDVYLQWTSTGTNTGIFGESAPTGKKVKLQGISHLHFNAEGKLVQEDVYYNELELLQQLGYTLNPPVLE